MSPELHIRSASSSRIRRRTGSPRMSKACIMPRSFGRGGAGVEGGGAGAGAVCGFFRRAIGDRGGGPRFAARRRERLAFVAQRPVSSAKRSLLSPVSICRASPISDRSQPTPTAPGPNRSQNSSDLSSSARDMAEGEACGTGAGFGQLDLDPAHPAAEFPCQCKAARRFARRHGAAGIALDLVAPAELEVALDRREPARNAFLRRDRVPQVVDVGRIVA